MRWLLALSVCALGACGGSGQPTAGPAPVAGRGSLLQNPPHLMQTVTAADLLGQLGVSANQALLALSGAPLCDIAVYHVEYRTVGGQNEATTASAALMVPAGTDSSCHGGRPIVLYAHGTTTDVAFDIADLHDSGNAEGLLLAALFAAQGYIVVAPNYAGYDTSSLSYHAYLQADQQSKDMIDALSASRTALPLAGLGVTSDGGRVYVTGYSQGGYVALATVQAMHDAGLPVTAAAPMSGPYALAAFFDMVMSGQVDGGAPVFITLLIDGYQRSYGNAYNTPGDIVEAQYAPGFAGLLPGTLLRSELYAQGKLPQYALFSATPPAPMYADLTPATQPANLAAVFALGFGAGNLITNPYRLSYLQDAAAHPDGAWPTSGSGAPATGSTLGLRQDLIRNDLRAGTAPTVPTLLCGGHDDPVVFWSNTQIVQNLWAAGQGANGLTVLDMDSTAASAPYDALQSGFAVAKAAVAATAILQGASDGGASAVFQAYHATLVAPFCLAAARAFFASH